MSTFTRDELRSLHRRSTLIGASIFLFDFLGFVAASVATVLVEPVWLQFGLAYVAGLFIAALHVVAHDACHRSLVPQKWLNRFIGTMSFLPNLYAYSLWELVHNRNHHQYTNILGKDGVWEPLTPSQYRALSKPAQWRYRFYRTFLGHFWYGTFEIWLKKLFFPRASEIGGYRRKHVADLALVSLWLTGWPLALYAVRSHFVGGGSWEDVRIAVVLGYGFPLLVSQLIDSATIYLHHTHPRVEWYTPAQAEGIKDIGLHETVHVVFPTIIQWMFQGIMEHTAHHNRPGIPLYHVMEGQRLLESRSSEIVAEKWSLQMHLRNLRCCKLFDTELRCWTDYEGRPSVPVEDRGGEADRPTKAAA